MLVVALGVQREVRARLAVGLEAVVIHETLHLRARDVRLAGLDRVQDSERLDGILGGGPRADTFLCSHETGGTGLGSDCCREVVPEVDVRALLLDVLGAAQRGRGLGRIRERDDSVAILAGVRGQLPRAELATLPAAVEGMLENVPAATGRVEAFDQVHGVLLVGGRGDANPWRLRPLGPGPRSALLQLALRFLRPANQRVGVKEPVPARESLHPLLLAAQSFLELLELVAQSLGLGPPFGELW